MRDMNRLRYRLVLALSCMSLLLPGLTAGDTARSLPFDLRAGASPVSGAGDPLRYTVYSNATDPHLVRAERLDGTVIDWYGLRDEDGVPERVQTVLVTGPSNEQFRMDLNESGAPTLIADSNGMTLEFAWQDACNAIITMTIVDQNVPVSGQVAWSRCPDFGPGIDIRADTGREPLPLGALGSAEGEVLIQVTECDGPLEWHRPQIYVLLEDVSNGKVLGRTPARWIEGSIYRAVIPMGQEVITKSSEVCAKTAVAIGVTCDALSVVTAPNPSAAPLAACMPFCMTVAFYFPPALPYCLVGCPVTVGTVIIACEASGPAGDVAQSLCDAMFEDSVAATLRLTAVAPHEAGRHVGSSVEVSSDGPFPVLLSIDVTTEGLCSPGPGGGSGYDCPPGEYFNPLTGRCQADSFELCPPGEYYNPLTGQCQADSFELCPRGEYFNPLTGRCEADSFEFCPSGQTRNPLTGQCEDDPDAGDDSECPDGQTRNPVTGQCQVSCDNGLWYDWEKDECVDACGNVPAWPCPEGYFPDPFPDNNQTPCIDCAEARQLFCALVAELHTLAEDGDIVVRYNQTLNDSYALVHAMRCAGCLPREQVLNAWDMLFLECMGSE